MTTQTEKMIQTATRAARRANNDRSISVQHKNDLYRVFLFTCSKLGHNEKSAPISEFMPLPALLDFLAVVKTSPSAKSFS